MLLADLQKKLSERLDSFILALSLQRDELTLVIHPDHITEISKALRDEFLFEQLIDVAGVDYSRFGVDEWETQEANNTGFSRGVEKVNTVTHVGSRFAVTYHLLSYTHNLRLRVKCFLHDEWPEITSVTDIWPAADWFEREAFDLFGIVFREHPDLRRILTDYGFMGHPFRKDFPLSGNVEMRYDANLERIVYEAVEIDPRILVPKVIRHDNRYVEPVVAPPVDGVKA